jgi:translocation and assembly module TamB
MVVSGTGSMRFGATGIDVTADVKADRGSLQLAERRGPTLSTDIVIIGREQDDNEAAVPSTPVRFDVKFDMGNDFKAKGAGFDGKLGGVIRIAGAGTDLRAIGAVAVREGTYEGYGQRLTIDRGNLIFSGPIDNPALDIVAIRKNLAVEAGVQISGTALAPQAKLTSTPNVPDTEKLSWLVLGHGLAASNKSDYALLTSAAAGLLGSSDSASIQSRIATTLGVDEIGVSGIGGDQGGLLTVGKQISSKLRVTLQQGFTKAATLIKVRYNVYKHIDFQVQTGTESALDLFYTFSFD